MPSYPSIMARSGLLVLALAFLPGIVGLSGISSAHAEDDTQHRTMTVTGSGEVTARPDIAYVQTGVVSEAKTAAEALGENTKTMNAIFDGLQAMKIDKDDIQTSEFSVSPIYNQPPVRSDGSQEAPTIRGYRVANQVSVTIRKLDTVGAVLDKLVSLGSNQLNGVRFAIENQERLLDKARADAVTDALRKAKLYAGAAGVAVGEIVSISEGGSYSPQPVFARAMMSADAAPVPVAAGTQKLSANVSIVIEIQ